MPLPASLTRRQLDGCKTALWLLCLMPLARLTFLGLAGGLGVNPIEFITPSTGTWSLVGLLATLAITPLRQLTGSSWLLRLRRLLGLFTFSLCLPASHHVYLA